MSKEEVIKEIEMELISTHVCKVSDVGFHGNLFGGQMLAWLDEAAAAYVVLFFNIIFNSLPLRFRALHCCGKIFFVLTLLKICIHLFYLRLFYYIYI